MAALLGVTRERVLQFVREGRLVGQQRGRQWCVTTESLAALIEDRRARGLSGPVRLSELLLVCEVARRWGLSEARVREVIRDGWLTPLGDGVLLRDVLDLEEMGLPQRWRERARRGKRLTPVVAQSSCGQGDALLEAP